MEIKYMAALSGIFSYRKLLKPILICILCLMQVDCLAYEKSSYELQAKVIANFIDHAVSNKKTNNFVRNICILENNPIISYLEKHENFKDLRKFKISRKGENDYLEDCDLLFISEYYEGYLGRIISKVKGKPVLTISNAKNFTDNGGIVQFTIKGFNRVEFTINLKEMKSSGIRIDESIISLSNIVN